MATQAIQTTDAQAIWSDTAKLEEVKKLFAPTLTDEEFKIFCGIGEATGLNPFLRELWAVKYKKWNPETRQKELAPATIFIGRDGYRKGAQGHALYDYHQCDAVYTNDDFEVVDGQIKHKYNVKDRGALIGAYCSVKRKKSEKPIFTYAELKEYKGDNKSLWGGKPATMIKKVAEAQGLRMAFQDMFAGTYDESEQWEEKKPAQPEQMKKVEAEVVEPAKVEAKSEPKMSTDQLEEMRAIASKIIGIEIKSGKTKYNGMNPDEYIDKCLIKKFNTGLMTATNDQGAQLLSEMRDYKDSLT